MNPARHPLQQLGCTRALACIAIANYFSLVVMNALGLPTAYTLPVYGAGLLLGAGLAFFSLSPRPCTHTLPPGALLLAGLFLLILTLPRLLYLAEWVPGTTVMTQFDDYARVAQLASMSLAPQYPLRHPSTESLLLSFYYSSLYPMIAVKQLLPILTLKDSLFIGNLLYHALVIGSLLEFSLRHIGRSNRLLFIFLATLFAGFDWLALTGNPWHGHDEWWQFPLFNGFFQISAAYTTLFWTSHHYLGAWLLAAAWMLAVQCRRSPAKLPLVTLLGLSAAFSSPFAALPGLLFLIPMARTLIRRTLRSPTIWLILASAVVPAFLFFQRVEEASFGFLGPRLQWFDGVFADTVISIPIYLLATALVDLAGLPLIAVLLWRRFNRRDKYWFAAATVFYLLTTVVSFSGFNNFAMRGMQLPVLFYSYAVARYLPATVISRLPLPGMLAIFALASYGSIREAAANLRLMTLGSLWYYETRGIVAPPAIKPLYRDQCRDHSSTHAPLPDNDPYGLLKYNACKLTDTPVQKLDRWEREIARSRPDRD